MVSPTNSPRILTSLKSIDAYPKLNEDFAQQTSTGGLISAVAGIIMSLLFISELRTYLTITVKHEMTVDTERNARITINFDVSFPKMPCSWISLDAMDISGELKFDLEHEVYRRRLITTNETVTAEEERHDIIDGKLISHKDVIIANYTCGSCYGAEDAFFSNDPRGITCCQTCRKVHEAYKTRKWNRLPDALVHQCRHEQHVVEVNKAQPGEGCRLRGSLNVNKVAGNFHFAPGRSYQRGAIHVHDLKPFEDKQIDFTHRIHHLSFGYPYPGIHNPLDDIYVPQHHDQNLDNQPGMFQYFLKVVPTTFLNVGGVTVKTNQYSVTEHFQKQQSPYDEQLPGVFFFYDLSPIKVRITEERESLGRFLTNLCAITGGVFTISGIIDSLIYKGQTALAKKIELGKFN